MSRRLGMSVIACSRLGMGVIACSLWIAEAGMPATLGAQAEIGNVRADATDWMWQWSPLRRVADLGMPTPRAAAGPHLGEPGPRIGLVWTAGNPAGFATESDTAWTRAFLETSGASGSYRRPLDAGSARAFDVGLAGWRRIGARLAVAGRVVVERASDGTGGRAAFANPIASSPFAPADTNGPARSVPGVRLEAAEAMSLGRWQLGAALGFRAVENSSAHAASAMVGRASAAGGALGAIRRVGRGEVGFSVRTLEESETVSLIANPQTVRVYALDGYRSVEPTDIGLTQAPYRRRRDNTGVAWTLGAAGAAAGARWTAFAEANSLRERQASALTSNAPTDRWTASGVRVGAALQRAVRGLDATFDIRYASQSGDATRASAPGGGYHADASEAVVTADVRSRSSDARWTGALAASLRRDWQRVADKGGRASTDIVAWSPGVSLEMARPLDARWSVGVGYGVAQYTPFASLPPAAGRGAAYQTLLAPAIEIAAATARSDQWSVTVRRRASAGAMFIRLSRGTLRPLSRPDASVPLPPGTRTVWSLAISVEPH